MLGWSSRSLKEQCRRPEHLRTARHRHHCQLGDRYSRRRRRRGGGGGGIDPARSCTRPADLMTSRHSVSRPLQLVRCRGAPPRRRRYNRGTAVHGRKGESVTSSQFVPCNHTWSAAIPPTKYMYATFLPCTHTRGNPSHLRPAPTLHPANPKPLHPHPPNPSPCTHTQSILIPCTHSSPALKEHPHVFRHPAARQPNSAQDGLSAGRHK